jgi:hypothetical protein
VIGLGLPVCLPVLGLALHVCLPVLGLALHVCLPVSGLGLCCSNPRLAYVWVRVRVACIFACVRVRVMLC